VILGRVGVEHSQLAQSKTANSTEGGAKSDARNAPNAPQILQYPDLSQNVSELAGQFPELIHIFEKWPALPNNIKEAIKALTLFENNHTSTQKD
jgi:hypothetical protein